MGKWDYKRHGETITVEQKNVGKGHQYVVSNHDGMLDTQGKPAKMPSVTGVCSATDGTATSVIARWSVKNSLQFIEQNTASDYPLDIEEMINRAKKEPDVVLKRAGDRGTRIHNAVEKYLTKEGMGWLAHLDLSEDDRNKLEVCFQKIERWIEFEDYNIVGTEMLVYHTDLYVGGAIDMMLASDDKKLIICDFKTGKGVYFKDALQMSGYIASIVSMISDGVELWDGFNQWMPEDMNKLEIGGIIFHINEDNEDVVIKHVGPEMMMNGALFTAAKMLHQSNKNHKFYESIL